MTADVRRRTVLTGLGAGLGIGLTGFSTLALTACSPSDDITVDAADQVALDQVLAGELALQEQAQSVPGGSARQAAAAHQAHADALVAAGGLAVLTTTPATGPPSTSIVPGATAASLAAAQRRQAAAAARLALGATPRIARLLSSIAASNASFAWLIGASR